MQWKKGDSVTKGHTQWVTKPYWIYLSCSASQMNLIYCGWQQGKFTSKRSPAQTNVSLFNEREAGPLVIIPKPNRYSAKSTFTKTDKSIPITLKGISLIRILLFPPNRRKEIWWTAIYLTLEHCSPCLLMSLLLGFLSIKMAPYLFTALYSYFPDTDTTDYTVWKLWSDQVSFFLEADGLQAFSVWLIRLAMKCKHKLKHICICIPIHLQYIRIHHYNRNWLT